MRFLLDLGLGARKTRVSSSLPIGVMRASRFSRSTRPSRPRFRLFWHGSHARNGFCCGVTCMFLPPCPFGQKRLSISTVFPLMRVPYDGCPVTLFFVRLRVPFLQLIFRMAARGGFQLVILPRASGVSLAHCVAGRLGQTNRFSLCSCLRMVDLVSSGSPVGSSARSSIVQGVVKCRHSHEHEIFKLFYFFHFLFFVFFQLFSTFKKCFLLFFESFFVIFIIFVVFQKNCDLF